MRYSFLSLLLILFTDCFAFQKTERPPVLPAADAGGIVQDSVMQRVYKMVKTPFKYGVILRGDEGTKIDCPSVFRHNGNWYMTYIIFDGQGYETAIARSPDLLHWTALGKILRKRPNAWDGQQVGGYIALQDHSWGGSYQLQKYGGKYWMSYLGGNLSGYETDPLAIGMAWTTDPVVVSAWQRNKQPVLAAEQSDSRYWEKLTLYKSNIIYDRENRLGFPFVMFYNAKTKSGYERIGMAVSNDMLHWQRYGVEPVIDNGTGLSGDPQVCRIGDIWVMFYFGAFWQPNAFDTFACSYDLVHWTKWQGPHLIEPTESWDEKYAHKPWIINHNNVVYHFYCAVGDEGRVIAVAMSENLHK